VSPTAAAVRRSWTLAAVTLLLVASSSAAQEPEAADDSPAVVAVESDLMIEQTLLDEDLDSYRALAAERDRLDARIAELQGTLDAAIDTASGTEGAERVATLVETLERSRADRDERDAAIARLALRIVERRRRVALLERRRDELASRKEEVSGELTGTWDVVLLPADQRGTCRLEQDGTLVSGTYRLEGGLSGSFQGTLVNRKVVLERIDSRLGRTMRLEGRLSTDGTQIRGTWLDYELAGGEGATGHWSARRRSPSGEP